MVSREAITHLVPGCVVEAPGGRQAAAAAAAAAAGGGAAVEGRAMQEAQAALNGNRVNERH